MDNDGVGRVASTNFDVVLSCTDPDRPAASDGGPAPAPGATHNRRRLMDDFVPRVPGYEVLGELGRGGMGIVYRAHSLRYDCPVALKMVLNGPGAGRGALARFGVEAQAIGSLQHPNIVRIHEVGVHFGYPYFILEYAPGGSLADRLASGPVPDRWSVEVCRSLALAMWHAHQRRIIHRDIKPANVLLMADDVPKIADFGLAKLSVFGEFDDERPPEVTVSIPRSFQRLTQLRHAYERAEASSDARAEAPIERHVVYSQWDQTLSAAGLGDGQSLGETTPFLREAADQATGGPSEASRSPDRLTGHGTILGTLRYMAPEQALGGNDPVGPPADVHALGAVLYEMMTGRPPFTGRDFAEVLEQVVRRPPVPPRRWRDSIDPYLEAICMKCLEKKPCHRYEDMRGLADDLQRILDGKRLPARTDPPAGQTPNGPATTRIPAGTTHSAPLGRQVGGSTWTRIGGGITSFLRSTLTLLPIARQGSGLDHETNPDDQPARPQP